ncbi:MAG: FtsW/RodA/SpoVE family cell cycle protein [Planctomycetota bacterium]|nr:FtsW/RodA/SpoVE family cell cycle protein [Planctomycetota bacterium]
MRAGQAIAIFVLTLLVFGVIMVASASLRPYQSSDHHIRISPETGTAVYLPSRDTDSAGPMALTGRRVLDTILGRDGRLALVALLALGIGALVPIERLANLKGLAAPAPWLLAGIVVLLLYTLIEGEQARGATRWLEIGGLSFQPSEIAKWGLPAIIAWHCLRHAEEMHRVLTGLLPPLVLSAIVCALIAKEDLGTGALVMTVCVAITIVAGARLWQVAGLAPIGIAAFAALVVVEPYRVRRITAFLNPFDDAIQRDEGFQVIQSMGAIAEGGLGGRGFGNSLQKLGYLPFDQTDFIFAIICEELGLFGAALVIFVVAGILLTGFSIITGRSAPAAADPSIAERAVPPFSRLFGFGILLTFGLQAVINIFVVTGLAPTKGIALPLISQGGTGWILTAFSLGLLISMDRRAWAVSRRAGLVATTPSAFTPSASIGKA